MTKQKNKLENKKLSYEENIEKIREMMEFLVKDKISEKLNKLKADEKKVYDLTGEKSQPQMVILTGFSAGKVSGIWQKLEDEGLLIKEGKSYRKVV